MKITEALKSLENSWSREEILSKIKNGENSEKIVNDFCSSKQKEIETLTNFINPDDKVLLSEIEDLSNIESKLINKIKNYSFNKVDSSKKEIVEINQKKTSIKNKTKIIKRETKISYFPNRLIAKS